VQAEIAAEGLGDLLAEVRIGHTGGPDSAPYQGRGLRRNP
jgi:hypothetical protein